jgi:hypothetical protein
MYSNILSNTTAKLGVIELDILNYSLRDLVARQAQLIGDDVVSITKAYSFPRVVLDYVVGADIGADYVSGSEGQTKSIKEYSYDGSTYTLVSTTKLKYTLATYPTKPTIIEVI